VDPGACPVVESALSEAAEEPVGVATAVPDPATATDAPNPNATRKPLPQVAPSLMMFNGGPCLPAIWWLKTRC
jgi:hypothetical protein